MDNYIELINKKKFTIEELETALEDVTFVSTRDGFDNRPFLMDNSKDLDVPSKKYLEGITYVDKFNHTREGLTGEFFMKSSMGMKKFICFPLYGDNGEVVQEEVFAIGTFKETFTKVYSRKAKTEPEHVQKPFVVNLFNVNFRR